MVNPARVSCLVVAFLVGSELPALASDLDGDPVARLTLETPALAIGAVRIGKGADRRSDTVRYATGLGMGFDMQRSPYTHMGTAADLTLYWGRRDEGGDEGGRTKPLEGLLRVELRAGGQWWASRRVRIDHEFGLGPCFDYLAYDAGLDRTGVGLSVSLRNTIDWRAWETVGLIVGPVLGAARRLKSDRDLVLLAAELRLGVSWDLT